MASIVGSILVRMGLDSAQFKAGLDRAQANLSGTQRHFETVSGRIRSIGAGLAASLAGVSFVEFAREGLDYASSLGEVASQLGVTTEQLQVLRYAASQSGLGAGQLDQAIAQLTRRLGDAARGSGAQREAFARLGIAVRDAQGHVVSAGQALPQIAAALQRIQSPAERAAALVDLFGRSGQRLEPLLAGGREGLAAFSAEAHRAGLVLSEGQIENADRLADSLAKLRQQLNVRIAGVVSDNARAIEDLASALVSIVGIAGRAAGAIARAGRAFGDFRARGVLRNIDGGTAAADQARANAQAWLEESAAIERQIRQAPALEAALRRRGPLTATPQGRAAVGLEDARSLLRAGPRFQGSPVRFLIDDLNDPVLNGATLAPIATAFQNMQAAIEPSRAALDGFAAAIRGTADLPSLLERLFPEDTALVRYREGLEAIRAAQAAGTISADRMAEANMRLLRELDGADLGGIAEQVTEVAQALDISALVSADDVSHAVDTLLGPWAQAGDQLEATNVRIVESFAQMAQGALSEVQRFVRGLESGNFLDVVSGILGTLDKVGGIVGGFNLGPLRFGQAGRSPASAGSIGASAIAAPAATRIQVSASPYFDVAVDGRVAAAAPGIAAAGSSGALGVLTRRSNYGLAG